VFKNENTEIRNKWTRCWLLYWKGRTTRNLYGRICWDFFM